MKKTLALILAALQLCFILAACNDTQTPADTDPANTTAPQQNAETTAPVDTDDLTEEERRALIDDELPDDKKFGGRDFIILSTTSRERWYVVEEQTGVTQDDLVYQRNMTVENDYQVNIAELLYPDRHAARATIQQALTSGDTEVFDLISYHMVDNGANAVAGLYLNWYDVPYIDFEKPWWPDTNIEDLTVNDKCFIAIGDVVISSIRNTYCYTYNKQMAVDAGVEDLYQLVRDGKWTMDKVGEIIDQVYVDVNANGYGDVEDIFGMVAYLASNMNTYLWSSDNPIIRKDDQGNPQYTYYTDKLPDIVSKVVELHTVNRGAYYCALTDTSSHDVVFNGGRSLFIPGTLNSLMDKSANCEFDCGVVPYPKFDENQKEYRTMIDGGADSMGISKLESDEEIAFIGLITEALCAESYKQIYPTLYNSMLKGRYADMPEDAEMIDIVVDGRIFDIGYIYDNWKGVGLWMEALVRAGNTNITSYYESRWGGAESYYNTVLDIFYAEE